MFTGMVQESEPSTPFGSLTDPHCHAKPYRLVFEVKDLVLTQPENQRTPAAHRLALFMQMSLAAAGVRLATQSSTRRELSLMLCGSDKHSSLDKTSHIISDLAVLDNKGFPLFILSFQEAFLGPLQHKAQPV